MYCHIHSSHLWSMGLSIPGLCLIHWVIGILLSACVTYIGTPPRIDKRTVNFSPLEVQHGDDPPIPFSFLNEEKGLQVAAHNNAAPIQTELIATVAVLHILHAAIPAV